MKLLHVIHSANPAGGGPIEGIKQLAAVGSGIEQVEVACLDSPSSPWIADFPMRIHALGPAYLNYGFTPRLIPWLRRHHGEYDIVVVNGIWQFNSLATWQVLKNTQTPYCVFTHGMLDPWFRKRYPLKHLKKCLYWPWADYRVLRDAAAVLFTSEEERIQAKKSFGLYRCNERVVRYGTSFPVGDPSRQQEIFKQKFPELANKRMLLFLGRIHEKKGPELLIEAFARLLRRPSLDPALQLVMAGPCEPRLLAQLKGLAHRLEISDRVSWVGMLSGDQKWGAYHGAEVFVLPSHQENFGISVAEALACGTPALISNKVNIWREIEKAEGGLVAEDSVEGAFELLQRWIELPDQTQATMRSNAKSCFGHYFEVSAAARSVADTLRGLIEMRKVAAAQR